MAELDDEWESFMGGNIDLVQLTNDNRFDFVDSINSEDTEEDSPECGKLNVSTKTKIIYIDRQFDLYDLFWKIDIMDYDDDTPGIIKKQAQFNIKSEEELNQFIINKDKERNALVKYNTRRSANKNKVDETTPPSIEKINQGKWVAIINVGYCRKYLLDSKKSISGAFYNCIVFIFREMYKGKFMEYHVKLFNSGKVEIPGIKDDKYLDTSIALIVNKLREIYNDETISEIKEKRVLVLVNADFNCNYYLNRDKLAHILKHKYKIKCNYDTSNYPGIQCKYQIKNGLLIPIKIFRTGRVLIVGKCEGAELMEVYNFMKDIIFKNEYSNISTSKSNNEKVIAEENIESQIIKPKRKKSIIIYKPI